MRSKAPIWFPFDGKFQLKNAATESPDSSLGKKDFKRLLGELIVEMDDLQRMLYAQDRYAVLLGLSGHGRLGERQHHPRRHERHRSGRMPGIFL